jgi:hypothetical protein
MPITMSIDSGELLFKHKIRRAWRPPQEVVPRSAGRWGESAV